MSFKILKPVNVALVAETADFYCKIKTVYSGQLLTTGQMITLLGHCLMDVFISKYAFKHCL